MVAFSSETYVCPVYNDICVPMSGVMMNQGNDGSDLGSGQQTVALEATCSSLAP